MATKTLTEAVPRPSRFDMLSYLFSVWAPGLPESRPAVGLPVPAGIGHGVPVSACFKDLRAVRSEEDILILAAYVTCHEPACVAALNFPERARSPPAAHETHRGSRQLPPQGSFSSGWPQHQNHPACIAVVCLTEPKIPPSLSP